MRGFALLAFSVLVILLSNAPHATDCQTIWDCGPRENCVGGTCLFDGLACKYDWECRPFQFCNTGVYQCQMAEGRCQTDADCYGGQVCDANNYCSQPGSGGWSAPSGQATVKIKTSACKRSTDCPTGQKCSRNKCIASSASAAATSGSGGLWGWITSFFRFS